jgi:hypothetical protein
LIALPITALHTQEALKNMSRQPDKNTVKIDAGTLVLIISALILLPLLITGFLSQ